MSTTSAKRPLEPTVSLDFAEDEADDSPTSDEPRKKGGKPGRKPLDSEAKSKRTAQNRAAQRAFRERKEKKMKELEDKVHALEELNQQSLVETEFLRSQLVTLVTELKRYRPENPNDSQVLQYLAKTENSKSDDSSQNKKDSESKEIEESVRRKMSFTFAFPWKNEFNNDHRNSEDKGNLSSHGEQQRSKQQHDNNNILMQFPSPGSSSKSSSQSSSSLKPKNGLSTPSNGDGIRKGSTGNNSSINQTNGSISSSNGFTPGSTSTGWMDNVFYNDDARQLPQFYQSNNNNENSRLFEDNTTMPGDYDSVTFSNQFNFNDKFDEQVSEFCTKLGQVCGTKDCPIPQKQKSSYSSPAVPKSPIVFSNTWDTPSEDPQQQLPTLEENLSDPSIRQTNAYSNTDGGDGDDEGIVVSMNSPEKNSELPFIDTSLAFPEEQDLFREQQPDNMFAEFIEHDPQRDTTNGNEGNTSPDQDEFLASGMVQEEPAVTTGEVKDNTNDNVKDGKIQDEGKEAPNSDVVVPSSDGKLLKCSEVWDRITSHPKYSDMDIDGLCQELMAKAKCSERGVVVQAEDVQYALNNRVE
ncbi:ZYRO0D12584p [Zygosaccharomyces rouxii]|uniref:ZYRO0D12584p n=2 Tax=Zygosaccharomyces rouxii TaxID=4956 RepID=C5DW77_ZYGRC|nr:uncharacterized protein ZYRO0D12584g [Zygosaccharomyces rouxii]KAH9200955.1 transcription factor PAP1-domain-containing protein [Zygosaccharomyces rouxii]CAR28046.1 ZYRO0D12584p [Zygosaccharomyces rouxii]